MKKFEVEGHEPSLLPEGKNWKMAWNDEFDGPELDRTKWDFRLKFWGKPFPAFTDKGIEFDGKSNMLMHIVERDGEYASAQLQTAPNIFDHLNLGGKSSRFDENDAPIWPFEEIPEPKFLHRYGYYECRCKLQKQDGWWSAFWLQAQTPGLGKDDPSYTGVEVDIMENFTRDGEVTSGCIYGSYNSETKDEARVWYKVEPTEDDYHRFGVHWTKDGYVFYCDGKETARTKEGYKASRIPQFIMLTTECQGYRRDVSTAREDLRKVVLPEYFTVDYVRVFDEIEE